MTVKGLAGAAPILALPPGGAILRAAGTLRTRCCSVASPPGPPGVRRDAARVGEPGHPDRPLQPPVAVAGRGVGPITACRCRAPRFPGTGTAGTEPEPLDVLADRSKHHPDLQVGGSQEGRGPQGRGSGPDRGPRSGQKSSTRPRDHSPRHTLGKDFWNRPWLWPRPPDVVAFHPSSPWSRESSSRPPRRTLDNAVVTIQFDDVAGRGSGLVHNFSEGHVPGVHVPRLRPRPMPRGHLHGPTAPAPC